MKLDKKLGGIKEMENTDGDNSSAKSLSLSNSEHINARLYVLRDLCKNSISGEHEETRKRIAACLSRQCRGEVLWSIEVISYF